MSPHDYAWSRDIKRKKIGVKDRQSKSQLLRTLEAVALTLGFILHEGKSLEDFEQGSDMT